MRLSILLPTHNRADVLPFAIESVLAQSFTDYELLVVGDGCTDGTADIVTRYMAQDARVRWFDLPKGPGFGYDNRNVALREARGELIGFMAHDDVIAPEHYRLLVSLMEDPGVHLGHTSAVWVGSSGEIVPTVFHLEDSEMREGFLDKVWNRLPATCFIHRREAFASVGMWDGALPKGADMDLWGRILRFYGPKSLRCLADLTTFHFRAIWRTQEFINPDNEPPWIRLHAEPGRLSPWLKLRVEAGQTEQEALTLWLREHPEAITEISKACVHALMTHAWDMEKSALGNGAYIQQLQQTISELSKAGDLLAQTQLKRDSLLAERDGLKQRCDSLRQQRDALKLERNNLKRQVREHKAETDARKKQRWWKRLF